MQFYNNNNNNIQIHIAPVMADHHINTHILFFCIIFITYR